MVDDNRSEWREEYDWTGGGDEWSVHWGGTESEWRTTVFPRIWPFVPAKTICEIGPGFGRWSQYLVRLADHFVGVDLSPSCVDACRDRFARATNAAFELNDGRSLPMLGDRSVDFVFSFDSLVHVQAVDIGGYLSELERVLTADGVAFLHHSNLGEYARHKRRAGHARRLAGYVPALRPLMQKREIIGWEHGRAVSMTAARFEQLAFERGLLCIGQEVINWAGSRLTDCISLVTPPGSLWERPNVVSRNRHFLAAGLSARSVSAIYVSLKRQ